MQMTTRISGNRVSREHIEKALTRHAEHGRIGPWTRAMRPHESGHRINLIGGVPLTTHSLRESAIVALALVSAELCSRPRRLGDMDPDERRRVTERAMAQVGAELQAAAPQLSAIMDAAESGELDEPGRRLAERAAAQVPPRYRADVINAVMSEAGPRYTAHITAEAYQDGNAVEVDAPGPQDWDCTAYAGQNPQYLVRLAGIQRVSLGVPGAELTDNDDWFQNDPAAPAWVHAWRGPFTIRITRES